MTGLRYDLQTGKLTRKPLVRFVQKDTGEEVTFKANSLEERMETTMSSKKGRYELFMGKDNKWYFNRIAGNGEIEHPSEGYATKGNAVRAIGTCMEDTSHYEITERPPETTTDTAQMGSGNIDVTGIWGGVEREVKY